jgi:hypothetical protein
MERIGCAVRIGKCAMWGSSGLPADLDLPEEMERPEEGVVVLRVSIGSKALIIILEQPRGESKFQNLRSMCST